MREREREDDEREGKREDDERETQTAFKRKSYREKEIDAIFCSSFFPFLLPIPIPIL